MALLGGPAAQSGARVAPASVPDHQVHLPPVAGGLLQVTLARVVAPVRPADDGGVLRLRAVLRAEAAGGGAVEGGLALRELGAAHLGARVHGA